MGVPPKVQPINAKILTNNIENSGLHCTHGCATESTVNPTNVTLLTMIKKTLGYAALMGVPPKVQPINATVLTSNIENSGLHRRHGCAT